MIRLGVRLPAYGTGALSKVYKASDSIGLLKGQEACALVDIV